MFSKMNRGKNTRFWEGGWSGEKIQPNLNTSLTKRPSSFRNNLGGGAEGVKKLSHLNIKLRLR